MKTVKWWSGVVCGMLVGCGEPYMSAVDSSSTGGEATSASDESTGVDASTGVDNISEPEPRCGDGVVGPGEACEGEGVVGDCKEFSAGLGGNAVCDGRCQVNLEWCLPICNDGMCLSTAGETVYNCPQDCPYTPNDGVCSESAGEDKGNSPHDCCPLKEWGIVVGCPCAEGQCIAGVCDTEQDICGCLDENGGQIIAPYCDCGIQSSACDVLEGEPEDGKWMCAWNGDANGSQVCVPEYCTGNHQGECPPHHQCVQYECIPLPLPAP